jgi:hypothetical protein
LPSNASALLATMSVEANKNWTALLDTIRNSVEENLLGARFYHKIEKLVVAIKQICIELNDYGFKCKM